MEYLIPFHGQMPQVPTVAIDRADWYSNEAITLHWEAVDYAEQYRLDLYRDGEFYLGFDSQRFGSVRSGDCGRYY